MNIRKKKIIAILLLFCYSVLIGQNSYPNFSDPNKQLEFVKKRIYIIEDKGSYPVTSGGGSTTKLANPLYFFTGHEPQYVEKQNPIHTTNYQYNKFRLEQNNKVISEIDLLSLLGLEDERNRISDDFREKLSQYEKEIELISQNPINIRYEDKVFFDSHMVFKSFITIFGGVSTILSLQGGASKAVNTFTILSWAIFIPGAFIPIKTKIETKNKYPQKPKMTQTMSNNQIKSLVNTYNLNIYKEIAGE
jgi:hypothetical protein